MKNFTFFAHMDGTMTEWQKVTYAQLFEEGFYLGGKPFASVIDALRIIKEGGCEISVLSSYLGDSKYALSEKNAWLDTHAAGLVPESERYFVPTYAKAAPGDSKVRFVELMLGRKLEKTDILLDDYTVNLVAWENAGGTAVKLMNGANGTKGTWTGARISAFDDAVTSAKKLTAIIEVA